MNVKENQGTDPVLVSYGSQRQTYQYCYIDVLLVNWFMYFSFIFMPIMCDKVMKTILFE